ncbi:DNA-binding barrel domain superfamily [Sesbania bispinosa]|nr:DNA-binding barrel domain superfamily [Sesbania bispinosa]
MPFPFDFFDQRKDQLGNRLVLFDDFGHEFLVPLLFGYKSATMWQVMVEIKKFYGIEKTLHLYLNHQGGCRFRFQIKDEEVNEILTPGLVKLRDNDNDHETGPGRGHRPVIICRRPARLRHPMQVFYFEKVISKSQSKGGQTLPLPRKIVEKFIRRYWRDLNLEVHGARRSYCCKLLWRPGSDKDCHLGQHWYNLVSEMELKTGDRLVFKSIIVGLNMMSVTIHHKGS